MTAPTLGIRQAVLNTLRQIGAIPDTARSSSPRGQGGGVSSHASPPDLSKATSADVWLIARGRTQNEKGTKNGY